MTATDDAVPESAPSRRRWLAAVAGAAVLALAVAAGWVLWGRAHDGQAMSIDDSDAPGLGSAPLPSVQPRAAAAGPPFVTAVSADRRHLVDQYGKPLLVRGDLPWAMMTRISPEQAATWFANRQRIGYNAAIVSLIGAVDNGGPSNDGRTFDGILPFEDGDMLRWSERYFDRISDYLDMAQRHGITVMLYPIDGWTIGKAIKPASIGQCREYGVKLAQRFSDRPNIVWMAGGDYFPATDDKAAGSDVDHCINAMLLGLREAGDAHLFSIQLGYQKSISDDNPYWASRVDWNFVYTYFPTYRAVLQAYNRTPVRPALLGEANYERENNQEGPDTTDETLRRQVLWSLTSGAAGEFSGSSDWKFDDGWEGRLDTEAVTQAARLHRLFAGLPWWRLVPDSGNRFVTGGRGTPLTSDEEKDVLEDDYVTAARTPDGRYAVAYLPAEQRITIDRGALAAGVRAEWVDPASGAVTDRGRRHLPHPAGKELRGRPGLVAPDHPAGLMRSVRGCAGMSPSCQTIVSEAFGPFSGPLDDQPLFAAAQRHGMSSSMRLFGQPLTRRVSRSVK